ncbi:MAG: type II secretion system protein [Candidatus Paceibacterota bacterium]
MNRTTTQQGYSFVEVLVAIAILLIGLVGPLTIAATGLKNATFAKEQNTAFFLAQEAIEGAIYLREQGGLQNLANDAVDPWAWVDSLPNECFTGTSGTPCRYNVSTRTFTVCDPVSECALNLHSTGVARYLHDAGGEATPFTRRVYFMEQNAFTLTVTVKVDWQSNTFGSDKELTLGTYVTNIYGN